MPTSKSFKDLSITFDKNPVTDDLLVTKNDAAIKRAVTNLILTKPGERFFNPNIGCKVSGLLFEPLDFITAGIIRDEIRYTINAFEPRVVLKEVEVELDYDNNCFDVIIEYTIIGQPENVQNLEFFLERTVA
jgi:phage baseplate assembly protein W